MASLEVNLRSVRQRMQRALERSKDPGREITLVAVTKTVPLQAATGLASLGVRDFGENRLPEALERLAPLKEAGMRAHFIGHLQTNKASRVVGAFDVIHSVDSLRLLKAVALRAEMLGGVQEIFLQVNVSGEASKGGISPAGAEALAEQAAQLQSIRVLGLMTMAPEKAAEAEVRRVFGSLRELARTVGLSGLSMGMSSDFEVAIEEGATHVRVGSALFEGVF